MQTLRSDSIERFSGSDWFRSPSLPTLAANEVLIEYFIEDRESYAFVVADDHVTRVALHVERRRLESETAFVRHYLGRTGATAQAPLRLHLKILYELLIQPLESLLRPRIIVVPDGCLNELPFHAFLGPMGHIADSHVVSYAPSSEAFKTACMADRKPATPGIVVGLQAADLPSVEQEVHAVSARIPGASVFRGTDITSALPNMADAAFIHIASHGLFRRDDPGFSMLFLGSDVLTAMDVSRMNLQAELITMSACSTGRGSARVEGFMRAFTTLGVPAMVASLWDVDDRTTAVLMDAFYARLSEQPDTALALADAMKYARERYDDPFYWAPFILIGRTRLGESWNFFRSICTNTGISQTP
jgi:CHAT domain-containing protein